jgi:hypothetical protein
MEIRWWRFNVIPVRKQGFSCGILCCSAFILWIDYNLRLAELFFTEPSYEQLQPASDFSFLNT